MARPFKGQIIKCGQCGRKVYKPQCQIKTHNFCSRQCFGLKNKGTKTGDRVTKVEKTCIECGGKFIVGPARMRASECKFCSHSCRSKHYIKINGHQCTGKTWKHTKEYCQKLSEARKGENNPNWKNGATSLNKKKHKRGWQYVLWKREVLKRDGNYCLECNKKFETKDMTAHHLKRWAVNIEQRFSVDNGVSLCKLCHHNLHKYESMMKKYTLMYQ